MEEGEKECATFSCSLDSGGLHGDAEGERKKKKGRERVPSTNFTHVAFPFSLFCNAH